MKWSLHCPHTARLRRAAALADCICGSRLHNASTPHHIVQPVLNSVFSIGCSVAYRGRRISRTVKASMSDADELKLILLRTFHHISTVRERIDICQLYQLTMTINCKLLISNGWIHWTTDYKTAYPHIYCIIRPNNWIGLCTVQCFTSPPTQYRLYGRRFLQVKRPNKQYQSTEGTHIVHQ